MIPLYKTFWDEEDIKAVSASIRRGTHWAEGPNIAAFEKALGDYTGIPYVVVCNSGTSALHIAMLVGGISPGDEVIVPSFTFIATANAARFVGATPVFADIEDRLMGLDPIDVERKITPLTRAIIAVHYGGMACRIEELRDMARQWGLFLIEDCAEALGTRVSGNHVGVFGDCGILSFCANKVISTGEGGAFLTRHKALYEQALLIRSHGREVGNVAAGGPERYTALGYNFRLADMNAALGISQLAKLDYLIAERRKLAAIYREELPVLSSEGSVYQLLTVRIGITRDAMLQHLTDAGIGCKVYFRPVHQTPFYSNSAYLPITEKAADEVISLPLFPGLTRNEVENICSEVKRYLNSEETE